MQMFSYLSEHIQDDLIAEQRYRYIIEGLQNTVLITFLALLLGLLLGAAIAIIRVSYQNGNRSIIMRLLNLIGGLYLTVIRGTPMVVQLMIMYFIILVSAQPITVAIVAFGVNSGAYVAEVIRSGIQSVDRGQTEAGRSLGLSGSQTMIRIVLP